MDYLGSKPQSSTSKEFAVLSTTQFEETRDVTKFEELRLSAMGATNWYGKPPHLTYYVYKTKEEALKAGRVLVHENPGVGFIVVEVNRVVTITTRPIAHMQAITETVWLNGG